VTRCEFGTLVIGGSTVTFDTVTKGVSGWSSSQCT